MCTHTHRDRQYLPLHFEPCKKTEHLSMEIKKKRGEGGTKSTLQVSSPLKLLQKINAYTRIYKHPNKKC